jgi:BirA family biotin operon repressor/biotin-[acetyl-CoA-carboxylase] ligase
MDYPATDSPRPAPVSPSALFGALSVKMIGRIAQWNGGEGFSTVRTDWLARAAGVGEDVRVRLADREVIGRFEAIDHAGSLVLRLPDGKTTSIAAGDVLMLPAPSPGKAS